VMHIPDVSERMQADPWVLLLLLLCPLLFVVVVVVAKEVTVDSNCCRFRFVGLKTNHLCVFKSFVDFKASQLCRFEAG
jgi:hypothetical protein